MKFNTDSMTFAGNWKMNGRLDDTVNIEKFIKLISDDDANIILFPPFTLISSFVNTSKNSNLNIGGQDCHHEDSGAFTGSISASMLRDSGADFVIIGHSEVRAMHEKGPDNIINKIQSAHENNLITIICVGEDIKVRSEGEHYNFISKQLKDSVSSTSNRNNTIIAYEPIWAIGTGNTATNEDIYEMHAHINNILQDTDIFKKGNPSLLYGGSVNPENAGEILNIDNVNVVLVGGSSLDYSKFNEIIKSK
ncbi:MAG: triose-phosphate isomerase [Pseudomonadota bacterium]|nr:triose-phosphate isomerase [Pseudomonadota bacterium]